MFSVDDAGDPSHKVRGWQTIHGPQQVLDDHSTKQPRGSSCLIGFPAIVSTPGMKRPDRSTALRRPYPQACRLRD